MTISMCSRRKRPFHSVSRIQRRGAVVRHRYGSVDDREVVLPHGSYQVTIDPIEGYAFEAVPPVVIGGSAGEQPVLMLVPKRTAEPPSEPEKRAVIVAGGRSDVDAQVPGRVVSIRADEPSDPWLVFDRWAGLPAEDLRISRQHRPLL